VETAIEQTYTGVDPSLTGFAIVSLAPPGGLAPPALPGSDGNWVIAEGDGPPGVGRYRTEASMLRTKAGEFASDPARLDHLVQGFVAYLRRMRPALVAIEGIAFSRDTGKAALRNGLAQMVRWAMWREGVPYLDVGPSQLKKYVTGSGTGDKALMLREVYKRWSYNAVDDNDADAYALAQLARDWHEGKGTQKWLVELRQKIQWTAPKGSSAHALSSPSPTSSGSGSARRRARTISSDG
jgi:Holliday junction resolvasome RuvABC endonuclease subunit